MEAACYLASSKQVSKSFKNGNILIFIFMCANKRLVYAVTLSFTPLHKRFTITKDRNVSTFGAYVILSVNNIHKLSVKNNPSCL